MAQQVGSSIDDFLDKKPSSSGRGDNKVRSWKKNKDATHGELTVWLPPTFMPTQFYAHSNQRVIEISDKETSEKKLIVIPQLFTCHEEKELAEVQKWRNNDGTAQHSPVLCPNCILPGVIARLVAEGKIGFADVVFEWEGSKDKTQIRAGGIYGHFRKKKGLLRSEAEAMRINKLSQEDAFMHDMRVQEKYLFAVVDDQNHEHGIQSLIESEGLAKKIRKAIADEAKKVEARTRIDKKDERVRHQWDPSITPYPFVISYDKGKHFDDRFSVVALPGAPIGDELNELLRGELPEFEDLIPGDCFALRAELEAHCKVKGGLPWDEIFGPAEKAGLMVPPSESKEEEDEEREEPPPPPPAARRGSVPEVRGGRAAPPPAAPIVVDEKHPVWSTKSYKPGPEFKGAMVHICPPETAEGAAIDRVIALFKTVAKEVSEIVACEHCNEAMSATDAACKSCGATYDDDGLASRPCVNVDCTSQVPLDSNGAPMDGGPERFICPKCGTQHFADMTSGSLEWKQFVPAEEPKIASPRRRRVPGK